jgi:NADH:ubiquinone oxidoreductase subunit K
MSLEAFLIVSASIFCIGLYGALARRNVITLLMSIELMFNAVNIALVAFAKYTLPYSFDEHLGALLTGQVFALFIVAVAASEVALGLGIVIAFYRIRATVDVSEANLMRR